MLILIIGQFDTAILTQPENQFLEKNDTDQQ